MIKAVLFDFDDTLVKSIESKSDAIKECGKRFYNVSVTDEDIKNVWGKPYPQTLFILYKEADIIENIQKNYESIREEFPMLPYEDAVETVEKLMQRYPVGIVTASGRDIVLKDLKMLNFPVERFFHIQTAEDTPFHKPDPRVFDPMLARLKKISIEPNQVVYIGDHLRDFYAARDAGLNFYGIANNTCEAEEFEAEEAQYVASLRALLKLI